MEQNKFNQWADAYFTENKHNQFLRLQQCIDDCNIKFGINLSKETFRGCLLRWCEQYGYEVRSNGIVRHTFKGFDGEQEAIYIKKPDYPKQPDTTIQWEVGVYFSPVGFYNHKYETLSDAIAHVRDLTVLIGSDIDSVSIQKKQPKEAAE